MASFDLTRKPWVPVVPRHGPLRDVSLREALMEAHHFDEILADSPLETLALNRLLQALFLRIFGKETMNASRWRAMREAGLFSDEERQRIETYFDEWQDEKQRLDLLHPERPFYQHPRPLAASASSIAKLFSAEASGNNPTLFDHALDDDPRPRSLAEAARGVVAAQATALGGGRSEPFYYSDAPLAGGAIFWLRGESLFDALLLNNPPSERGRLRFDRKGKPAWERDPIKEARQRPPKGYLDYLSWQSRLLRLETEETENGKVVVTGVWMSQGDKQSSQDVRDPLMAYRETKKGGIFPLKLQKDKALWRDAHVLHSRFSPEHGGIPPAFDWIVANLPSAPDQPWQADVFGLANDQAKIELWRHERMPIFPAILNDEERRQAVQDALKTGGLQARILQQGCRTCAAWLLYPDHDPGQLGKQAREEARALAESLDAESRYWARLETPFFTWLQKLAAPQSSDYRYLLAEWSRDVHRAALRAFDEATFSLDTSARHIRARTLGRSAIHAASPYASLLKATEEPT